MFDKLGSVGHWIEGGTDCNGPLSGKADKTQGFYRFGCFVDNNHHHTVAIACVYLDLNGVRVNPAYRSRANLRQHALFMVERWRKRNQDCGELRLQTARFRSGSLKIAVPNAAMLRRSVPFRVPLPESLCDSPD